jgi:hypothetical protein
VTPPDLRPLGAGEILDRAVTLFVRHLWRCVLIVALGVLPIAVLVVFMQPVAMLDDVWRLLVMPPGHPVVQNAVAESLVRRIFSPISVLTVLVALLLSPLVTTACTIAVARSYRGEAVTAVDAYRSALPRWGPQVLTTLLFFALSIGVGIAIFLLIFLIALPFVALVMIAPVAAVVIGVPLYILAYAASTVLRALLSFVSELGGVAISIEDPNPVRAVRVSLTRTLGRAVLWRSVLAGLALLAVRLGGISVVLSAGALIALLTHLPILGIIGAAIGGVFVEPLVICYLVVYSYDIRLRREGFDLAQAAQATP